MRRIRLMVNEALTKMDELFSRMYEADIKGGRPSIAPEKLLQILFSIRSERQLMEQTQYNMLFRWFIGPAMDDAVCGCRGCSARIASAWASTTRSLPSSTKTCTA
jgi:hypothetical protein